MYRFIENIGDFFTPGFYTEDFINKVINLSGYDNDAIKEFNRRFSGLKAEYFEKKAIIKGQKLHKKYIIQETHDFNTRVMAALGYDTTPAYANWIHVDDTSVIPARSILYNGSQARLVVLEMQAMIKSSEDDVPPGLFEQQYDDTSDKMVKEQKYIYSQWASVINKDLPEGCKICPSKINDCVTAIFQLQKEQRPQYIVIFAGNVIFLLEQDKWDRGAYLKFDLEELFSETNVSTFRNYYALFYLLASKEVLAGDAQIVLMDKIAEESFKNAYEVTKDLKEGVINAVELLANEALFYKKNILHEEIDETNEGFASDVKDDCLTIIYRLLFLFYAEARPEIGILPMNDEAYAKGYSLEILRDLEQTPLKSDASRNSYFFNDSLWTLFNLICHGHNDNTALTYQSFSVKKIDSPLFDDTKLKQLQGVKFRNKIWQEIICSLSLSKEQNRKNRGRISYANLGVNQLGSVYESLLAYRGFYAEEDYIEVHTAGKPEDGTFLVPRRRLGDFQDNEILKDEKGDTVILPKGQFVYRLNGRDRKKSASYYTPEVLTKSTVKYTLKGFAEKLEAGEMKAEELLKLKILEPAMGAAAFQNEVINQLAEMYLTYRQKEVGKHISPHKYQDEKQKVKAFIATKNIYGVDLNPTAIELGKLALWLNVIHKDMETPFFGHRIALGNAVIGAWFKAYDTAELSKIEKRKEVCTEWWNKAPHLLHFSQKTKKIVRKQSEIYHFLVPDKNMLGALQIKEEKALHPEIARGMQSRLKDWTKPITGNDILILKKISNKIDQLISEYIAFQDKIEKLTANNFTVWEHRSFVNNVIFNFDDKQELADARFAKTNAYHKLVTVMNYWCALWFWEYDDADKLPTREEYWADIEKILDIDFSTKKFSSTPILQQETAELEYDLFSQPEFVETEGAPSAEDDIPEEDVIDFNEDTTYTKEEAAKILESCSSSGDLFEGARTPIVEKLANRYHFFHPMLEFIEVFWLRDGFDVICGNPPWIVTDFDVVDLFSDIFPELGIRGAKSPEVRAERNLYFSKHPALEKAYHDELTESVCCNIFTGAKCSYPLLTGIKTDLFLCILENSLDLLSKDGYAGMVHPEAVYETAKLNEFRTQVYHQLRYHFQFYNELKLFAEVHHEKPFGVNIYGGYKEDISFDSIHNLYHPSTIDGCFVHDGSGVCHGKKHNGMWNTESHRDRIVRFTSSTLSLLSSTFESDEDCVSPKLINTQNKSTIDVITKLSSFSSHVRDINTIISTGFNETTAVDDGTIIRRITKPTENDDVILNGPHIYVSNPCYKMPRTAVNNNSSYDVIDFSRISEDFIPSTCFISGISHIEFANKIKGFPIPDSDNCYECWLNYYKLGISEWIGPDAERTLSGAILPPGFHHIGTIVSVSFKNPYTMIELAGLISSMPLDFYMKITGAKHVKVYRIDSFPIGIAEKYKSALYSRTLRLNCISIRYRELVKTTWLKDYSAEKWSIADERLSSFSSLSNEWNQNFPLRNYFERRQALIEIDVISAMALGLSLNDLIMAYTIQFPVLQQNEDDTWYDQKGNIVFTCSVGLKGVGVDRPIWEQIRNQKDGETYVHTIDPAKSELYGGQQVTYYAPYTKCDRIEDYRRAWAHFEKVFEEKL